MSYLSKQVITFFCFFCSKIHRWRHKVKETQARSHKVNRRWDLERLTRFGLIGSERLKSENPHKGAVRACKLQAEMKLWLARLWGKFANIIHEFHQYHAAYFLSRSLLTVGSLDRHREFTSCEVNVSVKGCLSLGALWLSRNQSPRLNSIYKALSQQLRLHPREFQLKNDFPSTIWRKIQSTCCTHTKERNAI